MFTLVTSVCVFIKMDMVNVQVLYESIGERTQTAANGRRRPGRDVSTRHFLQYDGHTQPHPVWNLAGRRHSTPGDVICVLQRI